MEKQKAGAPRKASLNPKKNKRAVAVVLSIVVMAAVSMAFFYPDAIQGNVLRPADTVQGQAIGHECEQWEQLTGEKSWWTNSLFGGMPMFQISPTYSSSSLVRWINTVYGLGLPSPANLLFMMMIGFFILMMACRTRWYVALMGAIAYAFSTYFIILIGAGHIWKYVTLAYIPPTIAGLLLCYRGRYLLGGATAALFAMLQIASNHVQMTYYSLFIMVFIAAALLVKAIKEKTVKQWGTATGVLAVAAILALAANSPNLYNTYKYSKETMRGGHSEIVSGNSNSTQGGLDKDYITAWSYGKAETFTLLIPNVKGGATIKPEKGNNALLPLADTRKAEEMYKADEITAQDYQYLAQFPQYFGQQPMTNGPVYVGAFILALFLVGCVIVKGHLKWGLVAVTALSLLLSWGHNFMWLTDLFIDYFPMYNKFRTVSSILIIAEITIPLLAMLALNQILTDPKVLKRDFKRIFGILGGTAVVCLFIYAFPGIISVYSENEQSQYIATGVAQQAPSLFNAIEEIRLSLITADALRSLIVIIVGTGVLLMLFLGKIKSGVAAGLLIVLTLFDLYSVNKRYVNHDSFITGAASKAAVFTPRAADKAVMGDTTMNYRVLDTSHFAEAMPSYFHKCVGGYHAAKLTRYQDLIDYQISRGNFDVLDMLNTRYLITSETDATYNPGACGNAWMVSSLEYVETPNEEMAFLDKFEPSREAVADERFRAVLGDNATPPVPGDTIFETSYAPNALTYHATSANGGIAVFSEVYFPWGWKATIDGEPAEIGRVNYILRAMRIPAGSHTIKMVFDPGSVRTTEAIAYVSIILIYLAVAAAIAMGIIAARRRNAAKG